ncbi:MAG: AarF/ABC1/UbiB kinase family protein [Dehalococcoidia bacterium]|nr:AarF/ABC1/UbiB kinase family protein [Dehalococcoidia bacterium]
MNELLQRGRRSLRVARTGAAIYVGYKRTQRRARGLEGAARELAWERQHERAAEALYHLAVDLKGLYIKTGQFIATRSDLVPAAYTASLSRLQDRVPPRPAGQVRAAIEHELGRPVRELFDRFDNEPLGAASLAQVHRARLHDGREVVVKVQYPEVGGLVRLDVRNLKTAVRLLARREPNFDYRAVVDEIGNQVPLELDFVREAEMTRRVAGNLAVLPRIVVPRVVDGYVSRRVLVTEFVPGMRLLGEEQRAHHTNDGGQLAQTIADAYGHQILVDGLFQADPHPGNILVLPDGRVALLDFGLTKELPEAVRVGFAHLVVATAARDVPAILRAFAELGVRTKSDRPEDVLLLMRLFFEPRDMNGGAFETRRRSALAQNPVEAIPGDLVLLGRVVGLLRGVGASLGAPLSPMQMLRPYAEAVLAGQPAQARA